MTNHLNISRRQMLAMSAAAALRRPASARAWAQQPVKSIDQLDPALERSSLPRSRSNSIADGMGDPRTCRRAGVVERRRVSSVQRISTPASA